MEIRPASNKRDWMDRTVNQFAYRCLPLQIANAAGWELLAPCDILFTWIGSNHKNGLHIHYSDERFHFADSAFGNGIITFHSGYIINTSYQRGDEMKYDLWVGGSPNYFYDFMQPLTGIVETWWLPFTFTMNFKIMQPGTYEIKKGQPIFFIMPIPHELPTIEAEIQDLSNKPDLLQEFNEWKERRKGTIASLDHMAVTGQGINGLDPTKPSTHWEKNYFRGERNDGTKIEDHQTKRRMSEFKNITDISFGSNTTPENGAE